MEMGKALGVAEIPVRREVLKQRLLEMLKTRDWEMDGYNLLWVGIVLMMFISDWFWPLPLIACFMVIIGMVRKSPARRDDAKANQTTENLPALLRSVPAYYIVVFVLLSLSGVITVLMVTYSKWPKWPLVVILVIGLLNGMLLRRRLSAR
jgi:hypothetical protein